MSAGLFALSVNPKVYENSFGETLFRGTFYQQHWNEESTGIAVLNKGKIRSESHPGLFRPSFKKKAAWFRGTEGIGFCGPDQEPFSLDSGIGQLCGCFSGNVINCSELERRFKNFGHTFERKKDQGLDLEIILKLIAQGRNVKDGIKRMSKEIKGAFSLLVLIPEGIYAACSPDGHWPLVIGKKKGAVVVASESGSFKNLGFELVKDLEPGEIIRVKEGNFETQDKTTNNQVKICSFLWVYSFFPNAVFKGISASKVRKRLGANLAQEDIKEGIIPDIVMPVPDSGRFHAIGYQQEFCRQIVRDKIKKIPFYDERLIKYPYAGRSFTRSEQRARDLEADIKILPSAEDCKDKVIVVNDDSIVRGTQMKTNLVPKLKALHPKEIHIRISNPGYWSHCPWGKTTKKGEPLARRIPSLKERTEFLGVDSLKYNKVSELIKAIGLPPDKLCVDCSIK